MSPEWKNAKEAHAWPVPKTDQRPVQQGYLAMASERGTQERYRRDDNGCTRPSTKNKMHSKSH